MNFTVEPFIGLIWHRHGQGILIAPWMLMSAECICRVYSIKGEEMEALEDNVTFSVVIPVYNREHLIKNTVDSVLAQTNKDFEIIVVDDGSIDHTMDILEKYGNRIKALSQSNSGPEAARHKGISEARGKYLVFLDSDDLLTPSALEIYGAIVDKFEDPPLIIGAATTAESENIESKLKQHSLKITEVTACRFDDYLSLNTKSSLTNSIIVVARTLYNEIHAHQPADKSYPLDDLNFLLRIGTNGPCVLLVKPFSVIYRFHEGNTISDDKAIVNAALLFVKKELAGKYPGGRKRQFERWSRIGKLTFMWVRITFQRRHFNLTLKTLLFSFPMIACAILTKTLHKFVSPRKITFELKCRS